MINKPPPFQGPKKIGSLIQSLLRGGGLLIRGLGFITCLGLRVQGLHPCLYGRGGCLSESPGDMDCSTRGLRRWPHMYGKCHMVGLCLVVARI